MHKLKTLGKIVLTLSVLFWSTPSGAADIYVRDGAEGGDGSKNAPYGALWKALDKAVRGDVVHVAKGTHTGKGGCGHFTIKVPDLTLVGGYNEDFSERNPFLNLTVLERAKDYAGDWTGLPEGIIAGKEGSDHSGLIVDGFVLNGESRNAYDESGIKFAKSYPGRAFQTNSPNVKIRNCVILNSFGPGVEGSWAGKENEISNTFIVNTFREAVSTRALQPKGAVAIKNCTIAFCWFSPGQGGGVAVFAGRQGTTSLTDSILAYIHTEDGSAGFGVANTFGNDSTVMTGNVFFKNASGYYKYLDEDKKNLLVSKPAELADLNSDPGMYMLARAGGNSDADPKLNPDAAYLDKFTKAAAPEEEGKRRNYYGMAYPLGAVAGLASKLPGKGVQLAGPFQSYGGGGALAAAKDYKETSLESFKKGTPENRQLAGKPVAVRAGMGPKDFSYLLAAAPREKYDCYKLNHPGEPAMTMKYVFGYFLRGSAADKAWQRLMKRKDDFAAEGVIIKGGAHYLGKDAYNYPVGIIVDEVSVP